MKCFSSFVVKNHLNFKIPNHVLINEYNIGEGIMSHKDGPMYNNLVFFEKNNGRFGKLDNPLHQFRSYFNSIEINKKQIIGVIIAFIGIVLIINGKILIIIFVPTLSETTKFQNYKSENAFVQLLIAIFLLIVMIFWSYSCLLVK